MGSTREKLICHPATPPKAVQSVWIELEYRLEDARPIHLNLDYEVICDPRQILLPSVEGESIISVGPHDNLWKTTCFEMFSGTCFGKAYHEFNFAADGRWAAYEFANYRKLSGKIDLPPRRIALSCGAKGFTLAVAAPFFPIAGPATRLGLSAIIEESDGTKSYWALAHPPGKPDFHHPDCFALTLEAPDPA